MTYVYRDGSRLTPWMLHCIERFDAAFFAKFGVHVLVTSGIRTTAEQEAIFRKRYTLTPGGRKVYDTRWWQGRKWYRIDPTGTVAQPGTSNHEIQGSRAAVDLRDTGKGAGIMTAGTARARWARANAPRFGLEPTGYSFAEPWHFELPGIYQTPPTSEPTEPEQKPTPPITVEEEDDDMWKPTVHVRTEGSTEYCLAHPEIGKGLPQHTGPGTGGKRTAGKVTTYLGFMVTADKTIGQAWARMYAKGSGNETSITDRAGYVAIQVEASRVAAEVG